MASINKKDENDVLKLIPDECENHSKYFASFILHRRTSNEFNEEFFKDYINIPVACISPIFIRSEVSYYGYRKKSKKVWLQKGYYFSLLLAPK